MCGECKEVFLSRIKLTEHKAKTKHKGGAVIVLSEPGAKKKGGGKSSPKSNKKPFTCPTCNKGFKSQKAVENHQRDTKHFDGKRVLGDANRIKEDEVKQLPAPKEIEEEVAEEGGLGYVVIRDSDYINIMSSIDILKPLVNLETIKFDLLPSTNSWLVSYELQNESDWDYILFYCDFVEIEHTLESFIALGDRLDLNIKPKVLDMASLNFRTGVSNDIYDTNECLFISHKEEESASYGELFVSILQSVNAEDNPLSDYDLLLIGGSWEIPRPIAPAATSTSTVQTSFRDDWSREGWIDVDDDTYFGIHQFVAEAEEITEEDSHASKESIEIMTTHPVYIITNTKLQIDKLVNVELVVIPKENPSEDDVQEEVNIEDDVQEEVNIEDDVQEEVNIEDDVEEEVNIEDDVQEEVNTDGSETNTIKLKDWFEMMRQNSNEVFLKLYWDQEGISLDWLNQNSELMKEPSSEGSKWRDLKPRDVVISIRNKTKEDTSNPIFDKTPRHLLLYSNFKFDDDYENLEYDEHKLLFDKDKDPNLLYLPSRYSKKPNYKKKKHPLKRFYPKTGNKRNYYLFPDSKWNTSISQEQKSS